MMATLTVGDAPAYVAVKTVALCPGNPARGLAAINGAILLLDSRTGLMRAVLGANWITSVRTAGLSAVMAKRLANPASSVVAFVGCGVEARSHLDAFAEMFPLREVRALGRGRPNIDALCAAAKAKGLAATVCTDPRAALEGADIVVSSITLDYSVKPFLDARWLKPGAFAAITDLAIPWAPEGMAAFDPIFVDDLEQEAASPKPMVKPELVKGDLAGLVSGAAPAAFDPGRRSAFVFRGIGLGDYALASLACDRAVAAGKGVRVAG
jgi:ornithine cyclodeaminase/alanine dehydrogenase